MENTNTALMINDDNGNSMEAQLTTAIPAYCSMSAKTPAEKAALYNLINNPDKRLADMINLTIKAKHLYAEMVDLVDTATGEVKSCPRILIIDENNVSYACVSVGVFGALKKLTAIFGTPEWSPSIPLKVRSITKGSRSILTLDIDTVEVGKK